jgi:hypothetical protein
MRCVCGILDLHGTAQRNAKTVSVERERVVLEKQRECEQEEAPRREMSAEYELNEIDAADTLHCSVGSRLSLFARELKSRRSSWHNSSALRLPQNCCYGSFVIHPNGRYVTN